MLLFLHNNAMRTSLLLCGLVTCTIFSSASAQPLPSEDVFVARFCQKLINDPTLSISAIELANDLAIIGPSLSPLILFSNQHPALNQAVLECMKTLLMKNADMRTPQSQGVVKKIHNAALERCQQECNLFCVTHTEEEMVATCLKNLGLYYSPIGYPTDGALLTERVDEQVKAQERNERKKIVIGASAVVLAILALITASNNM
ncbi:MAG: hypothetical protein QG632_883 [Candidatus Dependentiae bacterium]|nr:hypothetical protein [Candidatus Dependentiae bacterium]